MSAMRGPFVFLLSTMCAASVHGLSVQQAVSQDAFPPTSAACSGNVNGSTTSFSFNFTAVGIAAAGTWNSMSEPFESNVFLAEMSHLDLSENRTWKLRVGPGGNIYSFVAPMGEIMPPQKHTSAPWIDEVWQLVAVNIEKAHTPGQSWFIHQAGTYQKEPSLQGPQPSALILYPYP